MSLRGVAARGRTLIERVRVSVAPRFTVITGETGAGKSLLIDALSHQLAPMLGGSGRDQGALTAAAELLDRARAHANRRRRSVEAPATQLRSPVSARSPGWWIRTAAATRITHPVAANPCQMFARADC